MKTDDLIGVLSTNVEAVDTRKIVWNMGAAIAIGAAISLGVMILALGVRPDLQDAGALAFLFAKLVFGLAVVGLASVYLVKLARPGGEFRSWLLLTTFPFIGALAFAGANLAVAPRSHWDGMIFGDRWLECLLSIPIIAIMPFAAVVWAMRLAAPTDLTRTGALAGLVAGGVSATVYALHCTDDSLPFIALWYGGTIALCTFAGAKLGPRLLRW